MIAHAWSDYIPNLIAKHFSVFYCYMLLKKNAVIPLLDSCKSDLAKSMADQLLKSTCHKSRLRYYGIKTRKKMVFKKSNCAYIALRWDIRSIVTSDSRKRGRKLLRGTTRQTSGRREAETVQQRPGSFVFDER